MDYDWNDIVSSIMLFPNLEELHVCYNRISEISEVHDTFISNISLLNLEGNTLSDWEEVLKFGHLPNLRRLILTRNKFIRIHFPVDGDCLSTSLFPVLMSLSMADNSISDWSSINELNKLPSLTDLKMSKNPVFSGLDKESITYLIIAKIGRLQTYNQSPIKHVERQSAEIDYLKKFGHLWKKSGGNADPQLSKVSAQFTQTHPRYLSLVRKYGAVEDAELKVQSSALKHSVINVTLKNCTVTDGSSLQRKLLQTTSIVKVKALAKRLFRLRNADLKLILRSVKAPEMKLELDNDLKEISFYSMLDGDTIEVHI